MKHLILLTLSILSFSGCASQINESETCPSIGYPVNSVCFYSRRKPFGEFSNFSSHPIEIEDKVWPTSEHFYQAKKFLDEEWQEKVRIAPSPEAAAYIGRNNPIRDDVKDGFMIIALRAKYTQHNELKELLLSTSDAVIFEHTENDSYWGDGGDGHGENMLGKMLMQIRSELKSR